MISYAPRCMISSFGATPFPEENPARLERPEENSDLLRLPRIAAYVRISSFRTRTFLSAAKKPAPLDQQSGWE